VVTLGVGIFGVGMWLLFRPGAMIPPDQLPQPPARPVTRFEPPASVEPTRPEPMMPREPEPVPEPTVASAEETDGAPLRAMDTRILERATRPISGDKVKDAFPGESWKVNLYRDVGHAGVNRLKIDLDRDEKWDEKWSFESGDRQEVKRQVAPNDDEGYTLEFRLRNNRWVSKEK
jgi:hypothetical protein